MKRRQCDHGHGHARDDRQDQRLANSVVRIGSEEQFPSDLAPVERIHRQQVDESPEEADEEITAAGDDQGAEGDVAAEAAATGEESGDGAEESGAAADEAAAAEAGAAADKEDTDTGAEAAAEEAAAAEEEGKQVVDPYAPTFKVGDVPDDIDEQLASLDEQFEEGDIDTKEYRAQVRELETQKLKAEMASEFNEQSKEQQWDYAQQMFFDQAGNDVFQSDTVMRGALDASLRELYANEENAGKSNMWYLTEAAKMVNGRLGAPASAENADDKAGDEKAAGNNEDPPPKPTVENTGGRGKQADIPQTLSGKPQADSSSTDQFSNLDNLTGEELEVAMAGMSEAEQDRYLQG